MAKCLYCNYEIKKGAAFCTHCGRPAPISDDISEEDFFNLDEPNEPDGPVKETSPSNKPKDLFDGLYGLNIPATHDSDVESKNNDLTHIEKSRNVISADIPTKGEGHIEKEKPVNKRAKRRRIRDYNTVQTPVEENIIENEQAISSDISNSKMSEASIVEYKDIAKAVKEYADETVIRDDNNRRRQEQINSTLDDGRKKIDKKGKKKRKRERNYSEIDIYKLEQDLSKVQESDYDGYYEDILPIDHDRDMTRKLPIKTLLQAAALILGAAGVIYLVIMFFNR